MNQYTLLDYFDAVLETLSEAYNMAGDRPVCEKVLVAVNNPVPAERDPYRWWFQALAQLFVNASCRLELSNDFAYSDQRKPLQVDFSLGSVVENTEENLIFQTSSGHRAAYDTWHQKISSLAQNSISEMKLGWKMQREGAISWYGYSLEDQDARCAMWPLILIANGKRQSFYNAEETRLEYSAADSENHRVLAFRVREDVMDAFLEPAGLSVRDVQNLSDILTPGPKADLNSLVP